MDSSNRPRGLPGHIGLSGLRCRATQGDPPVPNQLSLDVTIQLDLTAVAESDAYADVVDLADLAAFVRESVGSQPRLLLETIAVHAARGVLQRYAEVSEVTVRVTKPEPAGLDAAAETVEIKLLRHP